MGSGPEGTPAHMIRGYLHTEFFKNGRRQNDVAAILGISGGNLSEIASGRRRVSASVAVRMHDRLGWPSLDFLFAQAAMDYERESERALFPVPQPVEA